MCQLCEASIDSIAIVKLYTRKDLIMMEKSFFDFHQYFYISAIQKLALNLPHVRMIGNIHCGNTYL